jgi:hypothetical protein
VKFAIFVIDSDTNTGGPDEMAAIDAYNQKLRDNGHWIMAFGMSKPGPNSIQNTQEFYSGQWIIEAEDLATAEALAAEGSKACNRRVELRPFL